MSKASKMARAKLILKGKSAQIVILNKTVHSEREFAQILGVSQKGLRTTLERFAETKSFSDRKRSGLPRKTTESDDGHIQVLSKRSRLRC